MGKWSYLLKRSFREGSIQVWRNKFLSLTTILLGGLIVFLLNFVFAIEFYADYSLKNLESRADFVVPLENNFDAFELDALQNELTAFDLTTEIREQTEMEGITIPPRLNIQFHKLDEINKAFEVLKKVRYASVIGTWDKRGERDFVQVIDTLLKFRKGVETTSFWLIILFLGGGVLLMINTFRIILFNRKNEIFIARLVGADIKFIQLPFLIEGLLLGAASSIIGILTFTFILREITFLPGGVIFLHFWNTIFSYEVLLTILVGMAGAWIAARKYMTGKFSQ